MHSNIVEWTEGDLNLNPVGLGSESKSVHILLNSEKNRVKNWARSELIEGADLKESG